MAAAGRGRTRPRVERRTTFIFGSAAGLVAHTRPGPLCGQAGGPRVARVSQAGTFYFATAENSGLPLAVLLNASQRHAGGARHRLSTPLKTRLIRAFDLLRQVEVVFCYSRTQERHIVERLGFPAARVRRIPFQVDDQFFAPSPEPTCGSGVLSVGREMRDYPTLFAALEGTGIPVTVVASSPWSAREDQTARRTIPANVKIRRNVPSGILRDLYRNAAVVVVPLVNVDFPAAITALFEAQAVGRPVVVSASQGIVDTLDSGSAVVVPCDDPVAMRKAVLQLIERPGEAAAIVKRGGTQVFSRTERSRDGFPAWSRAASEPVVPCTGKASHDDRGWSRFVSAPSDGTVVL